MKSQQYRFIKLRCCSELRDAKRKILSRKKRKKTLEPPRF